MASKETISVSDIKEPASSTTVLGVVTKVSPTLKEASKTKKRYFDGTFSDESGCKRFVSFKTSLFGPMREAKENGILVGVNNCVIKRSFNTDDLEIIVSDKSELFQSPKKFKINQSEIEPVANTVPLSDMDKIPLSSLVSVSAKAIRLDSPVNIVGSNGKTLTKQDAIISDATGTFKLVLWEGNVGKLTLNNSYLFSNLRIKKFSDARFLSFTVDTTWAVQDDIGEVVSTHIDNFPESQSQRLITGEIISVIYEEHQICPFCDSKMTVAAATNIHQCLKCTAKCKPSNAKKYTITKLQIRDTNGETFKVTMFNNVLSALLNIKQSREIIEEQLLSMDVITIKVNASNIVTAINST